MSEQTYQDAIDLHNAAIFRAAKVVTDTAEALPLLIREQPELVSSISNMLDALSVRILGIFPDPMILGRFEDRAAIVDRNPEGEDALAASCEA